MVCRGWRRRNDATRTAGRVVELELPGGVESAAEVVHRLVGQGAVIARFERVGTSLAELIERVVLQSRDARKWHHA